MSKILCIIFCFVINYTLGQPSNSARIVTTIGSHVTFNFNSISDFKDGITKDRHTRLGLQFADSTSGAITTGWDITVKASDASFIGSGGVNLMPLNVLEIKAEDAGTDALSGTFTNWQTLTNSEVDLYRHTTASGVSALTVLDPRYSTSTQIYISYRCGFTNKINGINSDYYETELEIFLRPVPWP